MTTGWCIKHGHKAVKFIRDNRKEGDLLMDVPARYSWRELKIMAHAQGVGLTQKQQLAGRDNWRARVRLLHNPPTVEVTMNDEVEGTRIRVKTLTAPLASVVYIGE